MTSAEHSTKRLGDFEIIRELGRGGMGLVFEARQVSLNRKVALKVLGESLRMTPTAVIRFRREAEAAAKLHHTNIVPIYATGEQDGTHYYAMELIEGPSLNHVIQYLRRPNLAPPGDEVARPSAAREVEDTKTRVSLAAREVMETRSLAPEDAVERPVGETGSVPAWLAEMFPAAPSSVATDSSVASSSSTLKSRRDHFDVVARMIAEVADGLDHAHDNGVIHRDMKPSNLLLSADGRLSITDFGLVRMLEQPGMTMTGEFVGSPLYMSPEQITAGRAPLDHRTDIYSLGVTLYELLTLQPPFDGERRDQVIAQILHKEPQPPRRINRRIPTDLETICAKAMDKDPDRRYQTGSQMAEDLRRFVNRFAISARRVGPLGRAQRWARRHRALSVTACFAVIVTLAATLFAYRGWALERTHAREQAMSAALNAAMSGDLTEATAQIAKAETHGAEAAWTLMLAGQVELFRGNAGSAVEKLEAAVQQRPEDVAPQAMLAYAYLMDGRYHEHIDCVALVETLAPVSPEDYFFLGQAFTIISPERAIEEMTRTIERRPSFHLARVVRGNTRAFHAMDREDEDLALRALEDVRAARTYLGDNLVVNGAALYARLAAFSIFRAAGKTDTAQEHLRQAGNEVERLRPHSQYLMGNFRTAHYYMFVEDLDGVRRVMREAVDQGQAGVLLEPCAMGLFDGGRSEEALQELDRIPDQDASYVRLVRAMLLLETPAGRAQAEQTCRDAKINDRDSGRWSARVLYLLGQPDAAREAASVFLANMQSSRYWEFRRDMYRYLAGQISERELLDSAGRSARNRGAALHNIGVSQLAAGDRAGARDAFEQSAASPVFDWGDRMVRGLRQTDGTGSSVAGLASGGAG